jgi:hypothetical protein
MKTKTIPLMKRLILLAFVCISLHSQAQVIWQKMHKISDADAWNIQESPAKVIEIKDGFLDSGSALDNKNITFGYLLKLDANGDSLWMKSYKGTNISRLANMYY